MPANSSPSNCASGHADRAERRSLLGGRFPSCSALLLLLLFAAGCATLTPLPPADLSAQGWSVKRGQAVWKFGARAPEVVGELVVAARSDGELFAQFSKAALTVAVARADTTRWELDLTMFQRRLAGRGAPDERFALFQLARQLNGVPPVEPWLHTENADGGWRWENPRTGEYLEGYWEP
jgi:hypothetical protein